jgi:transcription elongation factor GreA
MLEAVKKQLQAEVEALNHELSVTLPATLKRALQNGDLRENGDYHAALERQGFVQARLSQLRSRLTKLSHIDLTKIPKGRVGLGSRVTVKDVATGRNEEWELVIPDAMDIDRGHISVSSPLGRGLVDKEIGDVATVQLPAGTRKLKILELRTLHEQVESGLDEDKPGR